MYTYMHMYIIHMVHLLLEHFQSMCERQRDRGCSCSVYTTWWCAQLGGCGWQLGSSCADKSMLALPMGYTNNDVMVT